MSHQATLRRLCSLWLAPSATEEDMRGKGGMPHSSRRVMGLSVQNGGEMDAHWASTPAFRPSMRRCGYKIPTLACQLRQQSPPVATFSSTYQLRGAALCSPSEVVPNRRRTIMKMLVS